MGAPSRDVDVGRREDRRPREKAKCGCAEAAALEGFLHQVEREGRDQHPAAEGHHGCDDSRRHRDDVGYRCPNTNADPATKPQNPAASAPDMVLSFKG
jgi:hypothetical protein